MFTMTGRINRIKATLTRATEAEMQAVKQGQLQEALRNAPSYKQNLFCYMDVNGLTVDVKLSTRTVMFLYKVGNVTQIEAVETHTDIVTKDLVFDTPVTINGVEIKGLNYHADTDNFTTDSDTPILIQAKSKANIGMEACFGVEKYYTILRVEDGMFPSTNESENYLGYLMHNIFQMKLLLTSGIASFSHINLYFGLDTEGNSQLTVAPVIGGIGQEVRYTYQITFNQAEDSFTIDGSTLSMDSTAESFNDGSVYNLTEFLKNKTFRSRRNCRFVRRYYLVELSCCRRQRRGSRGRVFCKAVSLTRRSVLRYSGRFVRRKRTFRFRQYRLQQFKRRRISGGVKHRFLSGSYRCFKRLISFKLRVSVDYRKNVLPYRPALAGSRGVIHGIAAVTVGVLYVKIRV